MFSDLHSRIKLKKLKRSQALLVKSQDEAMRTFRAIAPSQARVDSKNSNHFHDENENTDEIARIETELLIKKAVIRNVIIPPRQEGSLWQRSIFDNSWHLTYEGKIDILTKLRIEAKDRTELLRLWLPSIIAAIGAIGAWIAALKR